MNATAGNTINLLRVFFEEKPRSETNQNQIHASTKMKGRSSAHYHE